MEVICGAISPARRPAGAATAQAEHAATLPPLRDALVAAQAAHHRIEVELSGLAAEERRIEALEKRTGATLRGHYLRIEYCQDREGFWLEPHTDIGAKKFTMLVYLSETDDAGSWGTDIYDNDLRHLGQAPGGFNKGLIFIPGHDTWHGVEKRHYSGVRKSIIVNYVIPEWRSRHELAYPDRPV